MDDFEVKMYNPRKHTFFKLAVAFILLAVLAAGCAYIYINYKNTQSIAEEDSNGSLLPQPPFSVNETTSLADIYENVIDSVVTVKCQSIGSSSFPFGTADGIGSGFIVTDQGHIITNYHVISAASKISVVLNNGNTYTANVIGYDSKTDIAIIKISPEEKLTVAYIGDSSRSRAGDCVFAIGTPHSYELHGTITRGIISYSGRKLSSSTAEYLQTDSAMSPGNSGGPLFNMAGEVVGINTSKVTTGSVENIGFAISSKTFKPIVENILAKLPTVKLGIGISGVASSDFTSEYTFPDGVVVISVTSGAPADIAGIQPYDIITEFDGTEVSTVDQITAIIAQHKEGDVISVKVVRDSSNNTIELSLTLKSIEFYE